jgi:hypothetical protein
MQTYSLSSPHPHSHTHTCTPPPPPCLLSLQIIGEGLFGQLPRVYGYGMLPSSQRLQFLLSALSQSLGDSPPAEEEPLEAAVTVVPMGSQRSLSPASPLGASPRLALGLGTSKPSRRLRKELVRGDIVCNREW